MTVGAVHPTQYHGETASGLLSASAQTLTSGSPPSHTPTLFFYLNHPCPLSRVYDGAPTKRGASGVQTPQVCQEGAERAAEDDPRERASEESRPSGSKGVDDRL